MPESRNKNVGRKLLILLVCVAVLVAADQWTKGLAVRFLKGGTAVPVIPGVLELVYVENSGAAFGMMQGMRPFFLVLAPLVTVALSVFLVRLPDGKKYLPLKICFLFIIAGALGNFADRLRLSYVIDFIYFKLIDFPVFNVADIYVTCASIALILLLLFRYKEEDF